MTSTTMNSKSLTSAPASGVFNTLLELFAATPLYIFIMALYSA